MKVNRDKQQQAATTPQTTLQTAPPTGRSAAPSGGSSSAQAPPCAEILAARFLDLAALNRRALLDGLPAAIDAAIRRARENDDQHENDGQ